jgi:predicted nucleic acid-binding protein
MKLVIDANVLFASFIKNNLTRAIMLKKPFSFYSPDYLVDEFFEHLEELADKTMISPRTLKGKVKELLRLSDIKLVEKRDFEEFLDNASKIIPDSDDVAYVALALKLNCAIWSNDKRLKEQNKVKVYSTEDLIDIL